MLLLFIIYIIYCISAGCMRASKNEYDMAAIFWGMATISIVYAVVAV